MSTTHLHTKPRKKSSLIIGLSLLIILGIYINLFPPEKFLVLGGFFLLLFISLFYLLNFNLNYSRRSLFLSLGITIFLILRAVDLKHWLYPLLIGVIIMFMEIYFYYKDKS